MAAKKTLDINPVFNHRKSVALVDTAEELVDSLDNLSVCLRHIEEKYVQNDAGSSGSKGDKQPIEKTGSLFEKLVENLEVARELTDILKREKWRLSRREMSVELRMGELEEYKSHLKKDMTDMNQTVDVLSMRIVQLENALCEAQEVQESTEAERSYVQKRLEEASHKIADLEEKNESLKNEIQALKLQRKDTVLRQQNQEMSDKMEIIMIENQRLKEIIREKDGDGTDHSESDIGTTFSGLKVSDCDTKEGEAIVRQDSGYSGGNTPTGPETPSITETTEVAYV